MMVEKMNVVCIIGAGHIGSRHLQALAKSSHPLIIYLVDPSLEALDIAKGRFEEVNGNFHGEAQYVQNLDEVNVEIDVCIVATTSSIRAAVTKNLLSYHQVRHIIFEKVLFAEYSDYDDILNLLKAKSVLGWVNCWRRMVPYYQQMQGKLGSEVSFEASGNGYGLGSNGIHLLDFFMMTADSSEIELSNDELEQEVLESKRSGYVEFMGSLEGSTPQNDKMKIECLEGDYTTISYTIESAQARYSIVEHGQSHAICSESLAESDWMAEETRIELSYQSDLTQHIVDELLATDSCELPSLEESTGFHKSYISNFIEFQKSVGYSQDDKCMIT